MGTAAMRAELELTQEGRRFLSHPAFLVVDINSSPTKTDPLFQRLVRRGLVEVGSLLLQAPTNENRYERLPSTARVVVQERMAVTVQVCQALGARSVNITHAEADTVEEDRSQAAGLAAPGSAVPVDSVSAGASRADAALRFDGLAIRTSWSFTGGEPDAGVAAALLEGSGIYDEALEAMIGLFGSRNRPLSHTFELSTESDIRRTAELLAEVGLPFLKLRAEFDTFRRSHAIFRSQIAVEFGA
jgi:hypothetical protein